MRITLLRGLGFCAALGLMGCLSASAADKKKTTEKTAEKPKFKLPPGEASKATTFAEAMAEGEQRMTDMAFTSAEKSYEKAVQLAKTNDEKIKAYPALANSQLNCLNSKKATDTYLAAIKIFPAPAAGATADPVAVKTVTAWYMEAAKIAMAQSEDEKAVRKICQQAIDSRFLPPDDVCRMYTMLVRAVAYDENAKEADKLKEIDKNVLKGAAVADASDDVKLELYMHAARLLIWGHPSMWASQGDGPELGFRNCPKAREYCQAALTTLPKGRVDLLGEIQNHMGDSYRYEKNYPASRAEFAKTLAMPKTGSWQYFLATWHTAESYRDEGNAALAREWANKGLKLAENAHNEEWRGWCDRLLKQLK